MRNTGYPGYGPGDVNSEELVAQRLQARYKDPYESYGRTAFVPNAILSAVQVQESQRQSLVQDKAATPADAPTTAVDARAAVEQCLAQQRPLHHMAERSSELQGRAHLDYFNTLKSNFETCGTLDVKSGTEFVRQFDPWYLGMAFPMTLPAAVGGYDVHKKSVGGDQKSLKRGQKEDMASFRGYVASRREAVQRNVWMDSWQSIARLGMHAE